MTASVILIMIAGALIIEGLAYALAPSLVERLLEALAAMPDETRRTLGILTALTGVTILWIVI